MLETSESSSGNKSEISFFDLMEDAEDKCKLNHSFTLSQFKDLSVVLHIPAAPVH